MRMVKDMNNIYVFVKGCAVNDTLNVGWQEGETGLHPRTTAAWGHREESDHRVP